MDATTARKVISLINKSEYAEAIRQAGKQVDIGEPLGTQVDNVRREAKAVLQPSKSVSLPKSSAGSFKPYVANPDHRKRKKDSLLAEERYVADILSKLDVLVGKMDGSKIAAANKLTTSEHKDLFLKLQASGWDKRVIAAAVYEQNRRLESIREQLRKLF